MYLNAAVYFYLYLSNTNLMQNCVTELQPISQCLKATKNSMMTAIFVMAAAAAMVVDHVC